MGEAYRFVCLDPRKQKRAQIAALLSPLGEIRWQSLPKIATKDWPETSKRSETALRAARTIPAPGLKYRIWAHTLRLQYNGTRAYFAAHPDHVAVAWNGLNGSRRVFMDAAKDAGAKTLYFELSPFPGRVTVDPQGVNFSNALPRHPAPYLAWAAQNARNGESWRKLGAEIRQRTPIHPPVAARNLPPLTEKFIFAPLQVPGDSQLRLFGGAFRTVESFVSALIKSAKTLPEGWHLRLKEHPSTPPFVAQMLRDANAPIYLDNATDTFAQVAASRGVVTVNSSVGLEAMFFDKPVTACGDCFWAIPGMASRAADQEGLNRAMSEAMSWTFDPAVRDAVLGFLDQVYYPADTRTMDKNSATAASALVAARLCGKDALGFWADQGESKG